MSIVSNKEVVECWNKIIHFCQNRCGCSFCPIKKVCYEISAGLTPGQWPKATHSKEET